jgi:hypothetical protein
MDDAGIGSIFEATLVYFVVIGYIFTVLLYCTKNIWQPCSSVRLGFKYGDSIIGTLTRLSDYIPLRKKI